MIYILFFKLVCIFRLQSLEMKMRLMTLKEHVALDWTILNAYGWKDVLKVEYNDPHKFASKLRGFPYSAN